MLSHRLFPSVQLPVTVTNIPVYDFLKLVTVPNVQLLKSMANILLFYFLKSVTVNYFSTFKASDCYFSGGLFQVSDCLLVFKI